MARKKPARTARKAKKQAKKKGASRPAARKTARKSAAKSAKKAPRRTAKSSTKGRKTAPARAKASGSRPQPKPANRAASSASRSGSAAKAPAAKPKRGSLLASAAAAAVGSALAAGVKAAMGGGKKPNIDRPRKTVADVHGIPSSLDLPNRATAAGSGRQEMKDRLRKNTSASPALTSGDVDADWESAETVGDEAPGGDNPTPDQDVVDDIGRALGVEYDDDEELQGGAEIGDRDRNRWEREPSEDEDEQ